VKQATTLMNDVAVAHIKAVQAAADEVFIKAEAGNSSQELAAAKLELGRLDHEFQQAKAQCKAIAERTKKLLDELSRPDEEVSALVPALCRSG
jgi:hypothetical protein